MRTPDKMSGTFIFMSTAWQVAAHQSRVPFQVPGVLNRVQSTLVPVRRWRRPSTRCQGYERESAREGTLSIREMLARTGEIIISNQIIGNVFPNKFDFSVIPMAFKMVTQNSTSKFHNVGNLIPILEIDTSMRLWLNFLTFYI